MLISENNMNTSTYFVHTLSLFYVMKLLVILEIKIYQKLTSFLTQTPFHHFHVCYGLTALQAAHRLRLCENCLAYLFIPVGAKCDPDKYKRLSKQSTDHPTPYSLHVHVEDHIDLSRQYLYRFYILIQK